MCLVVKWSWILLRIESSLVLFSSLFPPGPALLPLMSEDRVGSNEWMVARPFTTTFTVYRVALDLWLLAAYRQTLCKIITSALSILLPSQSPEIPAKNKSPLHLLTRHALCSKVRRRGSIDRPVSWPSWLDSGCGAPNARLSKFKSAIPSNRISQCSLHSATITHYQFWLLCRHRIGFLLWFLRLVLSVARWVSVYVGQSAGRTTAIAEQDFGTIDKKLISMTFRTRRFGIQPRARSS